MPGKVIQCLKKTKTENPLVLIDEVILLFCQSCQHVWWKHVVDFMNVAGFVAQLVVIGFHQLYSEVGVC